METAVGKPFHQAAGSNITANCPSPLIDGRKYDEVLMCFLAPYLSIHLIPKKLHIWLQQLHSTFHFFQIYISKLSSSFSTASWAFLLRGPGLISHSLSKTAYSLPASQSQPPFPHVPFLRMSPSFSKSQAQAVASSWRAGLFPLSAHRCFTLGSSHACNLQPNLYPFQHILDMSSDFLIGILCHCLFQPIQEAPDS